MSRQKTQMGRKTRNSMARWIVWGGWIWSLGMGGVAQAQEGLARFEFSQLHMGVQARLTFYASDSAMAHTAARAAFARLAELDSVLSDYRMESELNRLCARSGGPPVSVSPDLFRVLERAQVLARQSDGAFDVTAGPLTRLWRTTRRTGALPAADTLRDARDRTGWRKLHLEVRRQMVRLRTPRMQLDLGGIAKGYAADEALRVLARQGIDRALMVFGGDLVASGPPPETEGWPVEVAHADPALPGLRLAYGAVSTSGDTEQYVDIGGRRYAHIVDPRTGLGLTTRIAVTVLAPDGFTADGLATTLAVLGQRRGQRLLRRHYPQARAYFRAVEAFDPHPDCRADSPASPANCGDTRVRNPPLP
jgi:thiamine biosynthesis lipoprotein